MYAKHREAINHEYILLEKAGKLAKKMVDVALARQKKPDEQFEGFLNTLLVHHQQASEFEAEFNSIISFKKPSNGGDLTDDVCEKQVHKSKGLRAQMLSVATVVKMLMPPEKADKPEKKGK